MSEDNAEIGGVSVEADMHDDTESFVAEGVETIAESMFGKKEVEATDTETEIESEIDETVTEVADSVEENDSESESKDETRLVAMPQSWKKDMQEKWDALDDDTREYIQHREKQMKDGLDKDRTDANIGRTMRDIMTPHSELLKQQGVDEPTAVRYMLGAHQALSTGSLEQRQAALQQLVKDYNLNSEQINPEVAGLETRLRQMEQTLADSQRRTVQAMREDIDKQVSDFAQDHPYFDEIADEIAVFISSGLSLEDAYDKALWANESTRVKEMERQNGEKSEKEAAERKKNADKVRKAASAKVRTADTDKTPTAPIGTMADTMHATLREIQNRN